MPVLYNLQLARKQKISLIAVFALGGLWVVEQTFAAGPLLIDRLFSGCITGILRLHALYIATNSTDITYDNVEAATWSAAELNVGIMCACVPALRPVIGLVFPRLLASSRRGGNSNATYPTRGTYIQQNESVVELSHVAKAQSQVSRDDTVSFEHHHDPTAIRVKSEWTVSEAERV
jgi:hypothetical protein